MVAGGDHREAHGRAPQPRRDLREPARCGGGERRADREREPGVEAGHGRVLVVERGRQLRVEREPGLARDGVDEPDVRRAAAARREQGVDRQRDQPGGEHRVAQQHVVAGRAPVQADQRARNDDELRREVEVVEEPQRGRAVEGVLHALLDVDAQRLLEAHDRVGVVGGDADVADRHQAPEAVERVGEQEEEELAARGAAQHHAATRSALVPSARSRNHSSEPGRPQTSR